MAGHLEFEFDIRRNSGAGRKVSRPFNLLVLGNFSGRSPDDAGNLAQRRIFRVDLDSRDDLWDRFRPRARIQLAGTTVDFAPRDLDDFHPDRLFAALPLFGKMRTMRHRLKSPETAESALKEILAAEPAIPDATSGQGAAEAADDLFERLLGRPHAGATADAVAGQTRNALDAFVRQLVAPHVVSRPDPRADAAVDSVDLACAALMRHLLHAPEFQRLEASWRSIMNLVSEIELDEQLNLYVCDLSRADLLTALPEPGTSLQDSPLFDLLVVQRLKTADDTPWSVVAGDYYFGRSAEDIALLTALGAVAAVHGAVFLAGARPELVGGASVADLADTGHWKLDDEGSALWRTLRQSVVAPHLGLALPRLIGRLPYGPGAEVIDSFEFDEMPVRRHEHYLWTNPAFACAGALAQGFTQDGWEMRMEDHVGLGSLPGHHYVKDGESLLQPCAEVLIPESAMVAILGQGLIPVVSYRNQNTAALGRLQSIADPPRALAGPWQPGVVRGG